MKTIFEHIEHVKEKPHHIRKRIAFTATAVSAAIIAFVWLVGNISTGAFAIQGSTFADSAGQGTITTGTGETDQNIAGAAAALQDNNAPAHIEIVDTSSSTRREKQAEQTIIPF